jgi:hypothetical protein
VGVRRAGPVNLGVRLLHSSQCQIDRKDSTVILKRTVLAVLLASLNALSPALASPCSTESAHAGRLLNVPSTVHGFVGGESHDSYRIKARQGERLLVRLAWRHEGDNRAEATISTGDAFETAEPLSTGEWSANGTEWRGTIATSGTVYIYVVAHPSAHYTLTLRRLSAT